MYLKLRLSIYEICTYMILTYTRTNTGEKGVYPPPLSDKIEYTFQKCSIFSHQDGETIGGSGLRRVYQESHDIIFVIYNF